MKTRDQVGEEVIEMQAEAAAPTDGRRKREQAVRPQHDCGRQSEHPHTMTAQGKRGGERSEHTPGPAPQTAGGGGGRGGTGHEDNTHHGP
jgi:hypothetical protein